MAEHSGTARDALISILFAFVTYSEGRGRVRIVLAAKAGEPWGLRDRCWDLMAFAVSVSCFPIAISPRRLLSLLF
jgi:hypothetical protein